MPKCLPTKTARARLKSFGLPLLGVIAFGYCFSAVPAGLQESAVATASDDSSPTPSASSSTRKEAGKPASEPKNKASTTGRSSKASPAAKETGKMPPADAEKVKLTEAEWRKRLTPEEFRVLRKKGTERPFVNKFDEHFEAGTYSCAACGHELFESDTKFNSGCGWPAFYASKAGDRINYHKDFSYGMIRVEVTCAKCDSHLGHVFNDAPQTPTGNRYCINSVSLKFEPKKPQKD